MDGIIAKRVDLPYQSGERTGMQKIKKLRSADCVVGGFRYARARKVVGSLLLGLYDKAGLLHHVGFTSSFSETQRKQLTPKMEALVQPPGFTGQAPGGQVVGQRTVLLNGNPCRRSSSLKSDMITLVRDAFGTAPASYAGAQTNPHANAAWAR